MFDLILYLNENNNAFVLFDGLLLCCFYMVSLWMACLGGDMALVAEMVDALVSKADVYQAYRFDSDREYDLAVGVGFGYVGFIMVQLRSRLHVVDNSGVKLVRRIRVDQMIRRPGSMGRMVVASVMKSAPTCTMKKGDLVRGYIVQTVRGSTRSSGIVQRFDRNAVVLVNKKLEPRSNRIRVPLSKDLRRQGLRKLRSMAPRSL